MPRWELLNASYYYRYLAFSIFQAVNLSGPAFWENGDVGINILIPAATVGVKFFPLINTNSNKIDHLIISYYVAVTLLCGSLILSITLL